MTYVATGEVTTLEHELGDDAVELGVLVTEALLAGAEGAEVLDRLGNDIVEQLKVDAAGLLCRARGQQWFSSGSCTMHAVLESSYRQLRPGQSSEA